METTNSIEKSIFEFYSKREVVENFSLAEVVDFAKQRNLQEWFEENFYTTEAKKVATAISNEASDAELKLLICKLFDLPLETLSAEDVEEISATVAKNQRRQLFMRKDPGDDRKAAFVETQGELVAAIKDEAQLIYLCGGEFRIPLNRRGVTYIGCDNAVIDLDEELDVDFDKCEIFLEDVQVYLHHPINIKAEQSHNVKIIDGSKKVLGERPTLKEIAEVLRGKNAFETPEDFKARVEKICGVAVGSVLLEDKDYDIDAAQFNFKPRWNFDYIPIVKDFAADKKFSVKLQPHDAESLYNNERKLQLFADFTYQGGKLAIRNLYFAPKTRGKVLIEGSLPAEEVSSMSSGGLGYGLDIINDYATPSYFYSKTTTVKNIEVDKYGRDYTKTGGSVYLAHIAMIVRKASSFKSKVQIVAKGRMVDGKSILMVASLGLFNGTEVTIIANGSDAKEAVTELKELIDNFGSFEHELPEAFGAR